MPVCKSVRERRERWERERGERRGENEIIVFASKGFVYKSGILNVSSNRTQVEKMKA